MKGRYVEKRKYIVLLEANGVLQLLNFTYRGYFERWLALRKDRNQIKIFRENGFERIHLEFFDIAYF